MANQQIGLDAVLNDSNFQAGLRRYTSGLGRMESASDKTASVLARVGSVMSGALVVGAGAAVAAFGALTAASKIGLDSAIAWGEQLDKLSDQFGLTGQQASTWAAAFQHVGLSVEEGAQGLNFFTRGLADMAKPDTGLAPKKSADAIAKMKEQLADANVQLQRAQKRMSDAKKPTAEMGYAVADTQKKIARLNADIADGGKLVAGATKEDNDFTKGLKQLGVRATDTKGKLKTFDQIMPDIMEAFKKLPPGVKATDLAMKLFGARGGSKFLDFLRLGKTGLKDAQALVKEFGLDMSTDGVNALEDFGFAMNDLNLKIKGMWTQIGVSVLPIVRRFVDYISANVLPIINKWVKESLPGLIAGFERFVTFAQTNLLPIWNRISQAFQQFVQAFQRGGIGGILDELGRQLGNAFKGFDAAKLLGGLGNAIVTQLPLVWAKVQPELAKWSAQFWNWLTGAGGAIEQVSVQFKKVIGAIAEWVGNDKNTTPIWNTLKSWAERFWVWLTDPNKGAIIAVAEQMQKLIDQIRTWSEDPRTQEQLKQIGASVANEILDGIGRIFDNPDEGDNLIQRLVRTLWNAAESARGAIANIGANIASGFVEAIAKRFTDSQTAQRIGNALGNLFRQAFEFVFGPGGVVGQIIARAIQNIYNSIMQIIALLGNIGSGSSGFGSTSANRGGNLTGTGGAGLGSARGAATVQQPVITNNNSNARNVAVTFAPGAFTNAFVRSGLDASSVESIASAIANKTVTAVLNAA